MQYLLLIATDEEMTAALGDDERAAMTAEYRAFGEALRRRGVLLGSDRLRPTSDVEPVRR